VVHGCGTRASTGASDAEGVCIRRTHCDAHGRELGLVPRRRPLCRAPGCERRPLYGAPRALRATHCATHGRPLGLVNVASAHCRDPGCTKVASYGAPGTTTVTHCAVHGRPAGLVIMRKHRCREPGCETGASHAAPGAKTPTHCAVHGAARGYTGVKKPCAVQGCSNRVSHKAPGSGGGATHCAFHGQQEGFVEVNRNQCQLCPSRAMFGTAGCNPVRCARHVDRRTMVKRPKQRCAKCRASGVLEVAGGTRFCETHAPPGAANLGLLPCASCGLEGVLVNGTCETCDPGRVARVRHAKEDGVAWALQEAGIPVSARDVVLEPGAACDRARPDFQVPGRDGAWWVYVECDEHQHAHIPWECEVVRMRNLAEVRGVPVAFVRFNPDGYVGGTTRTLSLAARYEVLVHHVKDAVQRGPGPGAVVSVLRLFYDGFDVKNPVWETLVAAAS